METVPGGIYPMLFAFFDGGGRLDEEAIRRQVRAALVHGAQGIAALGLGTEVGKLGATERLDLLGWAADELGGRLPLCVTVAEPTPEAALESIAAARHAGAAWVTLQPPPGRTLDEDEQIAFYGPVADAAGLPVAIQNAPEYLPTSLTPDGLLRLHRLHPSVSLVKAEGSALSVRRLIEATGGTLGVFNGRGGLELTDNLRAGCLGMIPGMDCFDVQVRIRAALQAGDEETAERLYAGLLPLIVFTMQNLGSFLCYGKRVAARRLGLGPVHDRQPAEAPHPSGLAWAQRLSAHLPSYF